MTCPTQPPPYKPVPNLPTAQCPDCGGTNVHVIDGVRGARIECGDGGCGASWKPDAVWLDALFAEPERMLATLPQWARQDVTGREGNRV